MMKDKQSDYSFKLEKNYFLLYDFIQFQLIQFLIIIVIKFVAIFNDMEQIVSHTESFYQGGFIFLILLYLPYTFVVDFYLPKISIGRKILGFELKYPEDISLTECLKFVIFKLIDTIISPTRIFFAFLFSKFTFILFFEKYTKVYLAKIIK